MNSAPEYPISPAARAALLKSMTLPRRGISYGAVAMVGHIAAVLDPLCFVAAASFVAWLAGGSIDALVTTAGLGSAFAQLSWIVAAFSPFFLYEKRFGAMASRGPFAAPLRSHLLRFGLFAAMVVAISLAAGALSDVSAGWLMTWLGSSLVLTTLTRGLVAAELRRLQRCGMLTEVIAVVGAGPVADRLAEALQKTRSESFELLGIYDDRSPRRDGGSSAVCGSLDELIELGKTRRIDWILLTLPATAEHRLLALVQRLKALSVPIGLCPQDIGSALPHQVVEIVGDLLPVSLLAELPHQRRDAKVKAAEAFVPRWLVTLFLFLADAAAALVKAVAELIRTVLQNRADKLSFQFDAYDVETFSSVAAGFGQNAYGYAVTPNADHLIRLEEDPMFRERYAAADYILLDSRFLSHLMRLTKGLVLPVCTGSDLTAKLLADVIVADDPVVLIGCSDEQAAKLVARYGLRRLVHFNPPMGFIRDAAAVETCLRFIEANSPFRFCLLAVGAPQQETLAQHLKSRGIARGLALCIGASINFLTGEERRAPLWMQRGGIEWSYRLMQAPGRMASRYLVRGPRVFGLLRRADVVLRKRVSAPVLRLVPASHPAPAPFIGPQAQPRRLIQLEA
jgi:exopolysaccharide biosynthesis WecB/TagA/CpsF family protein